MTPSPRPFTSSPPESDAPRSTEKVGPEQLVGGVRDYGAAYLGRTDQVSE